MTYGIEFSNETCQRMVLTGTSAFKLFEDYLEKSVGLTINWDKIKVNHKKDYLQILMKE